jgi:hypothetical protein
MRESSVVEIKNWKIKVLLCSSMSKEFSENNFPIIEIVRFEEIVL